MKLTYCIVGLILLSCVYVKALDEFDEILIGEKDEKVLHWSNGEGSKS